jgi:hypothetical protein
MPMQIQPNTRNRCTIVWHDQPDVKEDVEIYAGEMPEYLHHSAIDETIFFSMPANMLNVGYDEGDWYITAIHEPTWRLSDMPFHTTLILHLQALMRRWRWA